MHREYHPEDMRHLHAHAFDAETPEHAHDDHRPLYLLTAVLGTLIAVDLAFGSLGLEVVRRPFGVSLATIAAVLGGAKILYGALEALVAGRIGADFALAQACLAALVLGEPFVAAEVVFIALLGEALEAITADRAMRAIGRVFDQAPRTARVRRDGVEVELPIKDVRQGDLVLVAAGERIAVDGTVVAGRTAVNQAALTGESMPVDKVPGEAVHAGSINQFGQIEVHADRVGRETTLGQVLRLVADAQHRKAPIQRTADRYARWFLPIVETVALLTIVAGYLLRWPDTWHRAVAVLVVACPCALVLATPAAIMASMAWLARHGVIIKGGAALERLAACDVFAFDKTGTLTRGEPELASIVPIAGAAEEDVLRIAASVEAASRHPLALALTRAARNRGLETYATTDIVAHPGAGIAARWQGPNGEAHEALIGNRRLLSERGIALDPETEPVLAALEGRGETPLLVAVDGRVAGLLGVRDTVRPEAHDVIHDLKHLKVTEIALLTGDRPGAAKLVAKRTHLKSVESEMLPADKARWIVDRQAAGRRVAMVGDGINDAPALAAADVGIAIAGMGADLAAEAGSILLIGEPLRVLPDLVRLSRATVAVIRQNILVFAFGLNALAMTSATLGILGPVAAAVLHQVGSLLVLLSAMRLLAFGDFVGIVPVRWLRAAQGGMRRLDTSLDPRPLWEVFVSRRRALMVATLVVATAWLATRGVTSIGPGEVGLVRRFGRFQGVLEPGLHVRWPAPIERVDRLSPSRIESVQLGFRSSRPLDDAESVRWETAHATPATDPREADPLILTGDGRLVELTATAQFRRDPATASLRRGLLLAASPESTVGAMAEASVRSVVARMRLDDLLTVRRREAESQSLALLRKRLDAYGLGLVATRIDFQDVHPPRPVVDAFRDVSRAESDRLRRRNDGRSYRAEKLASASGQARATRDAAEAARAGRATRASGEVDAFLARRDARASAPTLTDYRLYWEAMADTLARKPKLVLDPAASARRHLVYPSADLDASAPALKAAVQPGDEKP